MSERGVPGGLNVCGTCGASWVAPLVRRASCPYSSAHPSDAEPRKVTRRAPTLLYGEQRESDV